MTPTHWTSYNALTGPSFLPEDGRTLMISVVLDAGAKKDFEGIRVVVVGRECEGAEMSMTKITELDRSSSGYVTGLNHRKALMRSRGRHNHVIREGNLCTIVFELTSAQTYWGQYARLMLMGCRTPQSSPRVIYDHIEHNTSTLLFLRCSHSSQPEFSPSGDVRKPTRIRAHSVRVLPIPKRRPPWKVFNLPPTILSRIIFFAFSDKQKGWRKGLLACSLVCKSWAYLVGFFFTDFHGNDMDISVSAPAVDHDPPNITTVSRSLQRNPSRGVLMQTYSPAKYLRPIRVTNVAFMAFCEAQNTILRLSRSVTGMLLESTHAFLFQDFFDILCTLREVRSLQVTRSQRFCPPSIGDIRHLSFEEIFRVISFWPQLQKLKIVNWARLSQESNACMCGGDDESIQLSCHIEDLHLSVGKLEGAMLLSLTGPSCTSPSLRIVRLDAVKGLTNSDFLAFLTRVSPTLVSLTVTACAMPHTSKDEEYAIDVALPTLSRLEYLILDGDLSSANTLSRKVRRRKPDGKPHRIYLSNPPSMSLEEVLNAVSVTGWESISVFLDSPIGHSPQSTAAVAQAAQDRGIEFQIVFPPENLSHMVACRRPLYF